MPKQRVERVEDAILEMWELGGLAYRWAQSAAAITPVELDRYEELCGKAHVDSARLLYRFQQHWLEQRSPGLSQPLIAPAMNRHVVDPKEDQRVEN